ncbi:MAG: hypothetical protein WD875_03925 [Pirellulales bacterium]
MHLLRRPILALIVGVFVLAAAAIGTWAVWLHDQTPLAPRDAAERLVTQCQWQAAADACDVLLGEAPDDGEVVMWRGRSRLAIGQFRRAVDDFTRAIELRPTDAEPRYYRAMAHERLGETELAAADFDAARAIDPHQDKLMAAVRAEQVAADVQSIALAATRREEQRSAKRCSVQTNLVDQRASAMRQANFASLTSDNVRHEDSAANSRGPNATTTPGGRLSDGQSALSELWAKDVADTDAMDVTAASPGNAGSAYVALLTSRQPASEHARSAAWDFPRQRSEAIDPHTTNEPPPSSEPHSGKAKMPGADAAPRPISAAAAWQQFQQRQFQQRQNRPQQRGTIDLLASATTAGSQPTIYSGNPAAAKTAESSMPEQFGKYPIRTWSAYDAAQPVAASPSGGLGLLATSPLTISPPGHAATPAWLQSQRREKADNSMSTATIPLAAQAADMSAASAASRPGVLTTALYEFFAPPASQVDPPLVTHAAPLPDWIARPSFAAPK